MNSRIRKVRSILKEKGLGALLITKEVNVFYLTQHPISDSGLLITRDKNIIITDFRFFLEAKKLKNFILEKVDKSFVDTVTSLIKKLKLKEVGFEGETLSYNSYKRIKRVLKGVNLVPTKNAIESIRMIKEKEELVKIQEAIKISKIVFVHIKRLLKPGISEKELAKRIDLYIRSEGGDGPAFPTIVASGPNSASPHVSPTNRKIRLYEPIIVDFGIRILGYNSDLTRTFYLGKIDSKFYQIYNIVYAAQQKALFNIKAGRVISEVDSIARSFIDKAGFSERFGHALGHGIGMEVHESPKIFKTTETRFLPNMVLTIEPAIYIPRWGGVRLEDMVLVKESGCKVLTNDIDKSI